MNKTLITVKKISKTYKIGSTESYYTLRDTISSPIRWFKRSKTNDFKALDKIDFEVNQGDVVGIIGKNGAGKSTLLKILSKITPPTEGTIVMAGRVASLLEVGTGFHPELTGRENIYLNGAILGMTRREINRKFNEIVKFAEIKSFLDTPVKRYSSGMYVRLAFSVAAHLEPEILIVDEVLAVGDIQFQKKCLGKMSELSNKSNRTILFVSHNMSAIKQLCTKCILLEKGRIVQYGNTSTVVEKYLNESLELRKNDIVKEFKPDSTKNFQLLSVRIHDENGRNKNMFECDDEIYIDLICVNRKKTPGLYGYLSLVKDGDEILISDTYDSHISNIDSIPIGTYKINIVIPKRTIGHGMYTVRLSFTSPQSTEGFIVDNPGDTCIFYIEDHTTQRGNDRRGYLSTLLEWNITSIKV